VGKRGGLLLGGDDLLDISGHLLDLGRIELFEATKGANVSLRGKVNPHTFAAKPSSAANTVNVDFLVGIWR